MCEPGTCEDCCSTDEWIAPADLRRPPTASVEAPVSDARPDPVHVEDGHAAHPSWCWGDILDRDDKRGEQDNAF